MASCLGEGEKNKEFINKKNIIIIDSIIRWLGSLTIICIWDPIIKTKLSKIININNVMHTFYLI